VPLPSVTHARSAHDRSDSHIAGAVRDLLFARSFGLQHVDLGVKRCCSRWASIPSHGFAGRRPAADGRMLGALGGVPVSLGVPGDVPQGRCRGRIQVEG
jgi:hypothetical protein